MEQLRSIRKAHEFETWLERGGADPPAMAQVRRRFLEASPDVVEALDIVAADGSVQSFTDEKLVLTARRPGRG